MVLIPHCQHFQHDRYLVLYCFQHDRYLVLYEFFPTLPALSTRSLSCFIWIFSNIASTFNTIVILFYIVLIPHCQHFQHDRYLVLYCFNPPLPALSTRSFYMVLIPHCQHFQHNRYLVLYEFFPTLPALSTRSLSCFIWFLFFSPHGQHFQHNRYLVLYEFFPTWPALSTRSLSCFIWIFSHMASTFNTLSCFIPPCQHFQHDRYLVLYGFYPPWPALSTRLLTSSWDSGRMFSFPKSVLRSVLLLFLYSTFKMLEDFKALWIIFAWGSGV